LASPKSTSRQSVVRPRSRWQRDSPSRASASPAWTPPATRGGRYRCVSFRDPGHD
jgi:hypothetical protein